MIDIVLVEDHPIVRKGFRALIEQDSEYTIVAEAGDGLEAVELVRKHQPDVLVCDLSIPNLDGLEVVRETSEHSPSTRIVVLSRHSDEAYVVRALRHGASAYVLKDGSTDDLVEAIRAVLRGKRFFSPAISEDVVAAYDRGELEKIEDRYDTLTSREREVFSLLGKGLLGPEVGEQLFISTRTVDTHRANIMAKLGLRNHAELVRRAVERELLPPLEQSIGGDRA